MNSSKFQRSFVVTATLLLVGSHVADSVIRTRCDVALELQRAGISRSLMSNWVCLMENASGLDTRKISGPGIRASRNYGIFQINSAKWCTQGRRGGSCNVRCEDLADDNIRDDIECAKKIYNSEGFKAWDVWVKNCKNKVLPNVAGCRRR